jgi:chromosome segregation ATPase
MRRSAVLPALILCAIAGAAHAQENPEDRLRDALRQSVMEMRAAQDQAAQAAADLQKAQADKAALQARLDADEAKLAAAPTVKPADLSALNDRVRQLAAQTATLQQQNAKLQAGLQGATDLAHRTQDEKSQAAAAAKANATALQTCKATNARLIDISEQVLHLYESQSFRGILLRSYEPLIGTAKVRLQNLVQDYDDKIRDQEYVQGTPARK